MDSSEQIELLSVTVSYISPFILVNSIFLVLLFANLNIKPSIRRIIKFFAPLTFSVYIIHTNPLVWENIILNAFAEVAYYSFIIKILAVLGISCGIYVGLSLVDEIRELLFTKLGVKTKLVNFETKLLGKIWE